MHLTLNNISHSFDGEHFLFRGLDYSFPPGEVYALVGPSGSGKSTLLSIIAGWLEPTEGEVVKSGIDKTNWVFQNPHGVAKRTALDHVVLPLLAQGKTRDEAEKLALPYLEDFNLMSVKDRKFSELSGGEAQRLMLARALAGKPDLLLVDEPTAQLDMRTALSVSQSLINVSKSIGRSHNAEQNGEQNNENGNENKSETIVIIATHDNKIRDAATQVVDLGKWC